MLRNRLVRLSGDKLFLWIPSLNCWRLDEPALRVRILVVFTGQLQHHMWIFLFQLSISETAWKRLPILFTKTIDIFLLAFSSFFFFFHFPFLLLHFLLFYFALHYLFFTSSTIEAVKSEITYILFFLFLFFLFLVHILSYTHPCSLFFFSSFFYHSLSFTRFTFTLFSPI